MSSEPNGNIVFDTGPLLEIVSGSVFGAYAKGLLQSGAVRAFTNELNLGELRYLICRKAGEQESEETVKNLTESGFFTVSSVGEFISQAANMKCSRSLAFPDCFALSIGELLKIPVLFATRESELLKEIKKKAFKTEILFLDDFVKSPQRRVKSDEGDLNR
ncbi:MAG: PIN domain-containing protein [Nitrososphaerales archaeon]